MFMLLILLFEVRAEEFKGSQDVLKIGGFFPFSSSNGDDYYGGGVFRQAAVAAIMAVEFYNARNGSITSEFAQLNEEQCPSRIELEIGDTFSTPAGSFQLYNENQGKFHAIVGPARSAEAEPIAIVSSLDKTPTISYWATSPSLDLKSFYEYFSRTIPSDSIGVIAAVEWFIQNGITRLACLHVDDSYGQNYASALAVEATRRGIKIEISAFEGTNAQSIARAVDFVSVRIFFCIFHGVDLPLILNQAISNGMTGKDTTYIFTDAVTQADFQSLEPDHARAIAGGGKLYSSGVVQGWKSYEQFKFIYENHNDQTSAALATRYNEQYMKYTNTHFALIDHDHFINEGLNYPEANYAYDATVALALGACTSNFSTDPENFLQAIRNTQFDGVSGFVSFNDVGSRSIETANFVLENILLSEDNNTLKQPVVSQRWNIDHWEAAPNANPFIFSTGTTIPPSDTPEIECPPGHVQKDFKCQKCPAGSYQLDDSTCALCDGYSFSDHAGAQSCTSCGERSHIYNYRLGSTSRMDCTCEQGSYSRNFPISDCISCSDLDATCLGGTCQPVPSNSYWMHPSTLFLARTIRCRRASFCDGGREKMPLAASGDIIYMDGTGNRSAYCYDEFQIPHQISDRPNHWCAFGRSPLSPQCESATTGTNPQRRYFQISYLSVRSPVHNRKGRIIFTVFCFLGVFSLFLLINDVIRPRYEVLDVLLNCYQDIAMIGLNRMVWPRAFELFFTVANITLFDVDTYEPTQLWSDWSYPQAFWLSLSLPFIYLAFAVLKNMFKFFINKNVSAEDAILHVFGSTLQFFFGALPSLIIKVQSAFQCRRFYGLGRRIVDFNTQKCSHPAHKIRQFVALLYGIGLVLGLPLLIFLKLTRLYRQNRLCENNVLKVYGFLYKSFHSDALSWGGHRLMKQIFLATISTSMWRSPFLQTVLAMAVLSSMQSYHSQINPNIDQISNVFERFGLLNTLFLVVFGIVFSAMSSLDVDTLSSKDQRYERIGLILLFFLVQAIYLYQGLWYALLDARDTEARENAKNILSHHEEKPQVTELLDTFKGPPFLNYLKSKEFNQDQIQTLVMADEAIAPYVCDASSTNNYSHSLEATFYRHLDQSFPVLIDTLLSCTEERRTAAREVFGLLAKATYVQEISRFDLSLPIELIDRSSVLFFLLHCNPAHRREFNKIINAITDATPFLQAGKRRVQALKLALSLQRLYRAKFTERSLRYAIRRYSRTTGTKESSEEEKYEHLQRHSSSSYQSLRHFISQRVNSLTYFRIRSSSSSSTTAFSYGNWAPSFKNDDSHV